MQDYTRERDLEDELWDAIEEKDLDKISKLVESGCDLNGNNGASFEEGITFLMTAVTTGDLELVKLLVELGADVNAISTYGESALFLAVLGGYQEITDYLEPISNQGVKIGVEKYREKENRHLQKRKSKLNKKSHRIKQ